VLGGCGIAGAYAGAAADEGEDEVDGEDADVSFSKSTSDCLGYGRLAVPSSAGGGTALEAWSDGDEADEHPPSAGMMDDAITRTKPAQRP